MIDDVVILVHRHDGFGHQGYFLGEIAEIWREQGLRVRVVDGPGRRAPAKVAVLHVDLTVVPEPLRTAAARYPVTLNARVNDISKRRVSANLVRRWDDYDGPVVVKTNRNCGGLREGRHAVASGGRVARYVRGLRESLPWAWRGELRTADYPVFPSARDVPRAVWYNPNLIVERFLPERHDGFYCLRTWVFLGDRETNSLCYSNQPIVKAVNVVRREPVAEVPDELRRRRREMGFDFGKFDYGIVDGGRVVLYDVNRTPTLGAFPREQYLPRLRHLAEGIRAYL